MKTIYCVLILCSTLVLNAQEVKKHGQLSIKGAQLSDARGNPVTLRGLSLGWHNWWPRFYTTDVVNWLHKDWNCTVLRTAIGIDPQNAYLQDPEGAKAKIKAVVEQAIKEGIYVIIDWHSHRIHTPEAKAFFTEMATLYGKYPNVIYEIYNEPEQDTWPEIKTYSTTIISAIRKIDKDNIILVGTPRWDQEIHTAADDPIQGFENIMYTVHFYANTHKQWLRDRCAYALKKGLPIFISECAGMGADGNGAVNEEEWQKWIKWAEDNKISWLAWSVTDKNETCSMLYPSASAKGEWKESDLSLWGKRTRDLLRSYSK